jgi:CBS domain-containing protein
MSAIFGQVPIKTIVKKFRGGASVIGVQDTDKVTDAYQRITTHNILAVPVLDTQTQRYTQFIDIIDILCFILSIATKSDLDEGKGVGKLKMLEAHEKFGTVTCKEIANASKHDKFTQIKETESLALGLRVLHKANVYRAAVISPAFDNSMVGILTQSDVLNLVAQHVKDFKCHSKTLAELKLGFRNVVCVSQFDLIKDALFKIRDEHVSGVAVLDNNSRLIGNISASDLKHLGYGPDLLATMFLDVSWALQQIPKPDNKPFPITVRPESIVEEAIFQMVENHIHRVYIVDSAHRLWGVVTMTDIIKLLDEELVHDHPDVPTM